MDSTAITTVPTQLGDWWQTRFAEDWEPLERFFDGVFPDDPFSKNRIKKIDLGGGPKHSVLLVFFIKLGDIDSQYINCRAQVRPILTGQTLRAKTTLSIIENDKLLRSVQARDEDNLIQFKFTAERGDRFSLQVSLGLDGYCEEFAL